MNNLNKQVYIYSVGTESFYNKSEFDIHSTSMNLHNQLKSIDDAEVKKEINAEIKLLKNKLYECFNVHEGIRTLRQDMLKDSKLISIFDSVLTRTLGLKQDFVYDDIIIVQTYHFQVLESLIKNGFVNENGEKYIYFSSSAGQIRTKKSVFLKESKWNKNKDSLMCGLSVESINAKGGINTNKYQAYLALSNSASMEWKKFNINKAIVVDDLETNVHSLFDHIDPNTYEIKRQMMDINITHTDGCGMILAKVSKKSFMTRLPWIKGLLVPFPFDKFAKENNTYIVKDIYGKEWDIVKDDIQVIFTKSQFKLWSFYQSWEDYKDKFDSNNCHAAMLNEEDTSADAKLNYQMLQTLTDMTNEELLEISNDTIEDIINIGSDKETMLRVLGATETNIHKNSFQQALSMYPELLNDVHAKETIKNKKKAMVRDAKAGKLSLPGSKYTFICPDLYAFCEKLFLGIESPNGLLANGEVYCNLYQNGKVDVLRSPHLYREHGIRLNVLDVQKSKWFATEGIYTSIHDPISRLLQFDNDGDKSPVIQHQTLIEVAERNMDGIIPLYYEMAKAPAQEVNGDNIYHSLIQAYKANIGTISNNISKIWNSEYADLDVVKWLTMETNFEVDYAKTLYKPTRPENVNVIIKQYIKAKLPHFFTFAKNKDENKVEVVNNSTVNKLNAIIPDKRINFKSVAGKFDYKMLMKNKKVELDEEIINKYEELNKNKKWMMKNQEDLKSTDKLYVYKLIRDELLKVNNDIKYVTDILVKYLYNEKNSGFKETLWQSFGDIIVKNLKKNVRNTMQCEDCGKRVKKANAKKCCPACATKRERNRVKEYRKKSNENKSA